MKEIVVIELISLILAAITPVTTTAPKTPAETILLAEAHPDRGTTGVFQMTVAAAERKPDALYLNSSSDYRSPDDVTFNITPVVARALEKRLGAKPETMLIGKNVTVKGELRLLPVANMFAGRPRSLARYQHTVFVRDANQVTIE